MPGLISALLVVLALPPLSYSSVGTVCFIPLFIYADLRPPGSAAMAGMLFGVVIGAYAFLGVWVYDATAYLAVVTLFAALMGVFMYASACAMRRKFAVIAIPALWALIEQLLAMLDVPITMAVVLTGTPAVLQIAAIGGQLAVSTLLIMFQVALARLSIALRRGKRGMALQFCIIAGIPVMLSFLGLFYTHHMHADRRSRTVRVAVIQTDLSPNARSPIEADGKFEAVEDTYRRVMQQLRVLPQPPQLVVWPEVAFFPLTSISAQGGKFHSPTFHPAMLIFGRVEQLNGEILNVVYSLSPSGRIVHRHAKTILLPLLEHDFARGTRFSPHYGIPGTPGSMICYESAFSSTARRLVNAGAQLLTITTSDAYAGPSILPLIHLSFAQLRAIETARPVVRAANGGSSAIIDRFGHIRQQIGLFKTGLLQTNLNPQTAKTFYVSYGKVIDALWLMLGLSAFLCILLRRSNFLKNDNSALPNRFTFLASVMMAVFFAGIQTYYGARLYQQTHPHISVLDIWPRFQVYTDESELRYTAARVEGAVDSIYGAIAYLLRSHGINRPAAMLAQSQYSRRRPVNVAHAIDMIAVAYDMRTIHSRYLNTESRPSTLATPSIVRMRSGESMVLLRLDAQAAVLFSPLRGHQVAVRKRAFLRAWTGASTRLLPSERTPHFSPPRIVSTHTTATQSDDNDARQ